MEIVAVNKENINKEHICCAISNNKDIAVTSKKDWLKKRFDDGLVFKKGNVRGKCFIEYIPAEKAFAPIKADNYMYIDCLWVAGQYQGHGNSTLLLNECIKDSKEKNKKGLVILSGTKKLPFLADPKYLTHKGFIKADTAEPNFVLYYLPFIKTSEKPQFNENVKKPHIEDNGFVLYYSNQCPYTAKYVPLIEDIAKSNSVAFKSIRFETAKEAQNAPAPSTTYSLFYNGEFLTNEILSEKKFLKLIEEKSL